MEKEKKMEEKAMKGGGKEVIEEVDEEKRSHEHDLGE